MQKQMNIENGSLERVIAGSALPSVIIDDTGVMRSVNDAFAELLGYRVEDCVDQTLRSFTLAADRDESTANRFSILNGAYKSRTVERRYRHKDGSAIWVRAMACAIPDVTGKAERILVQVVDIRDQKRVASAMVDSELRWKIALESGGQGVWDHNLETGEHYYSPMWREMRGMGPGDRIRSELEDRLENVHPNDHEVVRKAVRDREAADIAVISYEFREKHVDGHWMWILCRGRAVAHDKDGRPIRVIGTDTDITALKEQAEIIRGVSQRLEIALTTSKFGVWEVDLDTREQVWDAALFELFGMPMSPDPIPTGTWEKLLHPDDKARIIEISKQAIRTQSDFDVDYRIVLTNGVVRHIRSRAGYFHDDCCGPKLIGVNWDVTAEHLQSEELRALNMLAEQRNRDLEIARSDMEYMSLHDALTTLPNRRHLDAALVKSGARTRKNKGNGEDTLALLHVDLDRFKQINDTLGHAAGDAMLMHVANILTECVHGKGMVARVGGDEFVILFDKPPSERKLKELARDIIVRSSAPMIYQGHECRSGVSIGIAWGNRRKISPSQLLVNADIALYRAKNAGRSRYEIFNAAMQAEVIRQKKCADEILIGLERNEFFAVYQPQFDAHTHDIVGAEALVRWNHPERGILGPDAFLGVAEDLNVVTKLDELVLDQALADLVIWKANGLPLERVSVNVSARRLFDQSLIANLKEKNIPEGVLSFELLESIFLDDQDDLLVWTIDHIREMGIGIEIDDFGTGHASILGLLQIGPNRLKIDRQLVAPLAHSASRRKLLQSIVDIGKSQNIEVVAEGVETMEQAKLLGELGCDVLQGYVFAKPMVNTDLLRFVKDQSWRNIA